MLFKSPVYSQASGSIAGITYSRNRGGMYARSRAIPTNPNSTAQADIRNCLANANTAWQTIGASARASWETYASNTAMTNRVGDTIYLTGQQQWLRTATASQYYGLDPAALFATAPTTYDLGNTGTLTDGGASNLTNDVTINVGDSPAWAGDDAAYGFVQLGIEQNDTINFYSAPFRKASSTPGDGTTAITSLVANYFTVYNMNMTVGNVVFSRVVVLQSDGRLSTGKIVRHGITA
jgi:enamine deaminase RidA (YjgF/YER057c/UK114 family)